jgi:MFS transporter, DHA1 family, multidrug resistance protein
MFTKTQSTGPVFSRDIRVLLRIQGVMNASHFMTVPLLALHMSMTLHFSAAAMMHSPTPSQPTICKTGLR